MKLDQLPEELYSAILATIGDLEERKRSTVALSRALPRSPVSWRWIYYDIRLNTPKSIMLLYQHLRRSGGAKSLQAQWVQAISSEVWDPDAQILADLFGLLPNLLRITLSVGTTFAPEHLDEIFQTPRPGLISLNITFRPYVQKATYYQFLKGAYFDSLLIHLSNWPATCNLRYLSIIQTLPPSPTLFQSFAQPIVFFSLEPISRLIHAPSISQTTHIRIQIPARPIAQFLSNPSPSPSPSPTPSYPGTPVPILQQQLNPALLQALEKTTFLDLSTTHLSSPHLPSLFARFPALIHLILDGTALLTRSTEITGEFGELGRLLATAGLKRARERDRMIKALVVARKIEKEMQRANGTSAADGPGDIDVKEAPSNTRRRTRGGRRGVATAKFSLRENPIPAPAPTPGRSFGSPAVSISLLEKIRILPPLTPLQSLCLTTFAMPTPALIMEWEADFVRGWVEGVAVLGGVRRRLDSGMRLHLHDIWKFSDVGTSEPMDVQGELAGLIRFSSEEWEVEMERGGMLRMDPPRLCFAGRVGDRDEIAHAEGCAHGVSWDR